jgi:8-oxo-dGTP pyrophosphatase MutT (NUDIX family)
MADQPIPAATLIVVRDRETGPPELLMVERAADMAFAGGALVFPGGRIDEADRALGSREGAARVAAIRETLEETAVAVALEPAPAPEQALALQAELSDGRDFCGLLERSGFKLALDQLTPFARWVPKFHAVRRFDTFFFIAAAPTVDWQPHAVPGECAGAFWISAADVLEREKQGRATLIFPTRRNLERLAQHSSYAEILTDARAHPIEPITPWVEELDGEKFVTIPDHLGYPVTRERLEGLWRG